MDREVAELIAPLVAEIEPSYGKLSEHEKSLLAKGYLRGARDENRRAIQAMGEPETERRVSGLPK